MGWWLLYNLWDNFDQLFLRLKRTKLKALSVREIFIIIIIIIFYFRKKTVNTISNQKITRSTELAAYK